jgi:hypothetical protein|tara:strand:- start:2024 stop:2200 length:177 start_codon:yes stop_codon:yes gene_type:complete
MIETLQQIKEAVENLSMDVTKCAENSNKSAGTRARKTAQDIKGLCQDIRKEILSHTKK